VFSFKETSWEPKYLSQIEEVAKNHKADFFETRNIADSKFDNIFRQFPPDIMFFVSWRYLVPAHIYNRSNIASIVFHDSLLPAYRGFSPTPWAMINGESQTGVTMFHIANDVDSGDIIDQAPVSIGKNETIKEVMDRVTEKYTGLLEKNLELIIKGQAPRMPQDHSKATYTSKRRPEDNQVNWNCSATEIYNLIRATTFPYPGAYTMHQGRKLKIWSASLSNKEAHSIGGAAGTIIEIAKGKGVDVLTGKGTIRLELVQYDENEKICASELFKKIPIRLGQQL